MKLYTSGKHYLEAIYILQKEKKVVRSCDVALHLGYSKGCVSHTVRNLCDAGFISIDSRRFLILTDAGRDIAERIYEKRCFFKDGLVKLGIDTGAAEAEAGQLAHVISCDTFERIKSVYQ